MNSNLWDDDAATPERGASWRQRWLERGLRPLETTQFYYERPDGQRVVRKTRFALMSIHDGKNSGDKTFTVQHRWAQSVFLDADNWKPGIGKEGWEVGLLYRRVALDKALASGADILVCEGEKDADNAASAWGYAATSHYQGGAGMRLDQAEVLAGAKGHLFLCMDQDVVGVQLAWHNALLLVRAGVSPAQIQFLSPAINKTGADISDHIYAGLDIDELRSVSARQMRELIAKYGPLPKLGSGGRGFDYETRELAEQLGTHGEGWQVQRG